MGFWEIVGLTYVAVALLVILVNVGYTVWYFYLQPNAKALRGSAKFSFKYEMLAGIFVGLGWIIALFACVYIGIRRGIDQSRECRRQRLIQEYVDSIDKTLSGRRS